MKKKIFILSVVLVFIIAGGYVGNMFGVFAKGNYGEYGLENTVATESSPIKDKTIIFLGSSVTYGYGSLGVSFADFLEKSDGIHAVKEAVSGTTLVDEKSNSYVSRLKTIDTKIKVDDLSVSFQPTMPQRKNLSVTCLTVSISIPLIHRQLQVR